MKSLLIMLLAPMTALAVDGLGLQIGTSMESVGGNDKATLIVPVTSTGVVNWDAMISYDSVRTDIHTMPTKQMGEAQYVSVGIQASTVLISQAWAQNYVEGVFFVNHRERVGGNSVTSPVQRVSGDLVVTENVTSKYDPYGDTSVGVGANYVIDNGPSNANIKIGLQFIDNSIGNDSAWLVVTVSK